MKLVAWNAGSALALALLAVGMRAADPAPRNQASTPETLEFGRDIRSILADNCFLCHGPDAELREAELRLDRREQAFADRGGYFAIVPGNSEKSELIWRITADGDDLMPPLDSGKSLEPEEIELLRRWIDEGARWEEHWAYVPPRSPVPPSVGDESWPRNPIDRFVLARLEAENLAPEREATHAALIRRATLDLTGLPPTIEELDAFLADEAPDAYEQVIDRLLASPRYGEHMARTWLDAARYGDTHGLHLDNERVMWPYRDWVIDAFNRNMPFDRFTIEQLAGDLLPEPELSQLIATGFNRCNPTSAEGGMIEEEYLVKYAVDRVETTATVWLGTTMICARCHDHKFDPIAQKEFYELFAFFDDVAENASDENARSPAPVIAVPSPEQERGLERLDASIAARETELDLPMPEVDAEEIPWRASWEERLTDRWRPLTALAVESTGGSTLRLLEDGSILAEGENPDRDVYEVLARTDLAAITALRIDALLHDSLDGEGVGRAEHGNIVLGEVELAYVPADVPGEFIDVPLAVATADYSQDGFDAAKAIDGDDATGWAVDGLPEDRVAIVAPAAPFGGERGSLVRVRLRFESSYSGHAIGRFRLSVSGDPWLAPASLGPWHVMGPFPAENGDAAHDTDFGPETVVDLDAVDDQGRRTWVVRPELADDAIHELEGENCATYLFRTIEAPSERTLELSLGTDDAFKLWLNGELVLDRRVTRGVARDQDRVRLRLAAGENRLLLKVVNHGGAYAFTVRRADEDVGGLPVAVAEALGTREHTADGDGLVRTHFRRTSSPEWKALAEELAAWREERATLDATVARTLIMRELPEPRPAHVLIRGQYDRKGEEVVPGTPAALPPLPDLAGRLANRLDLARWLVEPDHPLTARVAVNRLWQELFGTGLVATPEDFGVQGEWPSHPLLLDWLAVELVESGWDVQHVLRLLVGSATYRQAARSSAEKLARDPKNRLLARGARFRLDAERVRDQALALSGLLVERIGGPSVRPYQPPGIWQAVAYTSSNTANFERDSGDALYHRSLYTFWKRTAPPPGMQIFDAPTREFCTLGRARTNTPLQALTLLNDEQFVEAARAFAERVLLEGGTDEEERVSWAFRLATARRPDPGEARVLLDLVRDVRAAYRGSEDQARDLIGVGESEPDATLDPVELAAWTHVTQVILNLDEVVTRG